MMVPKEEDNGCPPAGKSKKLLRLMCKMTLSRWLPPAARMDGCAAPHADMERSTA